MAAIDTTVEAPGGTAGPAAGPTPALPPIRRRPARRFEIPALPFGRLAVEADIRETTIARERAYRRLLGAADALAATIAINVALGAPGQGQVRWTALLLIPLTVLIAKVLGLYDRDELVIQKTTLDDAPRLAVLAMTAVMAVWIVDDLFVVDPAARSAAALMGLLLFAGCFVGRAGARAVAARVTPAERCMLIGDDVAERRLERVLAGARSVSLVRRLSLREAHLMLRTGADPTGINAILDRHQIHRVIFEPTGGRDADATLDIVRGLKAMGVRVSVLPSALDVVETSVVLDDVGGITLLGLPRFGLSRSSAMIKRALDIVVSSAALLVLSPLIAVIAIAIKLDSPGPVFFRQLRIGRDGEGFRIIKFRTMVADAELRKPELADRNEADGLFKISGDPRITRVGARLRALSLDEMPQLINVLRGEMSLVGPRPLIVDEDSQIMGWDRARLALTPGMTGPWQIAGSARVPLSEMLKIDYRYAATWTLWADCKILLRTIVYVTQRQGM